MNVCNAKNKNPHLTRCYIIFSYSLKPNRLSVSMSSLEHTNKPQSNYLTMKPILWQNSNTGIASPFCQNGRNIMPLFSPVDKQRILWSVFNNQHRTRSPSGPSRYGDRAQMPHKTYEHVAFTRTGSVHDLNGYTAKSMSTFILIANIFWHLF